MPKDCPKCKLVNPDEAQRCDCGWDFVTRRQERSYIVPKPAQVVGLGVGIIIVIFVIIAARILLRVTLKAMMN